MKVKGGRTGKISTKRMAMQPRWRKARPESQASHHLTVYERLTLQARRHQRDKAPPPVAEPASSLPPPPDLPPSLLAERVIAWSKSTLGRGVASLAGLPRRMAGGIANSSVLGRACRIMASPWTTLRDGVINAFAPVTAEGDRARGAGAFHGPPREVSAPAGAAIPEQTALAIVKAALADVPEKGDPTLPEDLSALANLLSDPPPTDDFRASDLVRDCFAAQGMVGSQSRPLLGVALRLTREFGLPTRVPLASDRAWRMLDPVTFEDEMAAQLEAIRAFISDWQKTQQHFLCLEFAEIDLIEWLFESLHPSRHSDLLFEVMNFKVLSNRRQGMLRRIPHRVRKFVKDNGDGHESVLYVAGNRNYLKRVVTTHGFTPIVETATICLEEVEKVFEKLKTTALPGPAGEGDGHALARITPVKMPASELADRAIAAAQAPAAAQPPAASQPPVAPQPLAVQPLPPPAAARPAAPPPPAGGLPVPQPSSRPAEGLRPAITRLQPKHIRAGAVVTIPSRSAGRIPLGRMFSVGNASEAPVPAISVATGLTRPAGRPSRLPGPISAVIPPSLPYLALPAPSAQGEAAAQPAVVKPAAPQLAAPQLAAPKPAVAKITVAKPAAPTARVAVIKPQAPPAAALAPAAPVAQAPAPPAADAAPAALSDNVTKLTMVQKRRLPITQALKRQAVMRVLRGEDAEAIALSIGISRTKLDEWVDKFISAGAGALTTSKKRKAEELTVDTLRTKLAEVLATAQLIEQVMESSLPRRPLLLPPPSAETSEPAPPRRPRKKRV
jgi:transposase-like protein